MAIGTSDGEYYPSKLEEVLAALDTSGSMKEPAQPRNAAQDNFREINEQDEYGPGVTPKSPVLPGINDKGKSDQNPNQKILRVENESPSLDNVLKQLDQQTQPPASASPTQEDFDRLMQQPRAKDSHAPKPEDSTIPPNAQPTQGIMRLTNKDAADLEMNLTPQEKDLYDRHILNLHGPGGVDNPDGSRSSLYAVTAGIGDKTYIIPTVKEGKILDPKDAVDLAIKEGIDKFPGYATEEEAQQRYNQLHSYMEKDTEKYLQGLNPLPPLGEQFKDQYISVRDAVEHFSDYLGRNSPLISERMIQAKKEGKDVPWYSMLAGSVADALGLVGGRPLTTYPRGTPTELGTPKNPNSKIVANDNLRTNDPGDYINNHHIDRLDTNLDNTINTFRGEIVNKMQNAQATYRAAEAKFTEGRSENPANQDVGPEAVGQQGAPNSWINTKTYSWRLDSNSRPAGFMARVGDKPEVAEVFGKDAVGVSLLDPAKAKASMAAGEPMGPEQMTSEATFFRNPDVAKEFLEKAVQVTGANARNDINAMRQQYLAVDKTFSTFRSLDPETRQRVLNDVAAQEKRNGFQVIENNQNPVQEPQAANKATREQIALQKKQQAEQAAKQEKVNVGRGKGVLNDNLADVQDMISKDSTPSEIARKYDITPAAVRAWMKTKGAFGEEKVVGIKDNPAEVNIDGTWYRGASHADATEAAAAKLGISYDEAVDRVIAEGFYTNKFRHVSREEAFRLADKNKQISTEDSTSHQFGELYSEDLKGSPYEKHQLTEAEKKTIQRYNEEILNIKNPKPKK